MKIKQDFVTNSSSSSFIVIDAKDGHWFGNFGETLTLGSSIGETEFGWGVDILHDIGDRINFAYIQALEVDNKDWLYMLDAVIKKNTGVKNIVIPENKTYGEFFGYVDHASSSREGKNIEMFESKEILKDFLFGYDSKIVLDNDNH